MKIKISKSQWEQMGKKAGWMKTAIYRVKPRIQKATYEMPITQIDKEGNEVEIMVNIVGYYTPAQKETRIDPGIPAGIEDMVATNKLTGEEVILSEKDKLLAEEKMLEAIENKSAYDEDEAFERKKEMAEERRRELRDDIGREI
jgi:hypothetical protein